MESLAKKYRPQEFDEVCSQKSVIKILERQLSIREIKNSYLFAGASGCGKTTLARIFANKINGGVGNPIELDAASNNGVDNIKQIVKTASERSIDSEYKVYIIDECHSLTNQAWQSFLKCLEEPPTYTVFIFCTTDPQKIPATVLNRCMRFNFNKIPTQDIVARLKFICEKEGFSNFDEACDYVSRICDGCMREAISLIDKCSAYSTDLNINNVLSALGNYSYDTMFELINAVIDCNINKIINIIDEVDNAGNDLKLFVSQLLAFSLDVTKYLICKELKATKIPSIFEQQLLNSINFDNAEAYYNYLINKLLELKNMLKNDTEPKTTVLVRLMGIARCQ